MRIIQTPYIDHEGFNRLFVEAEEEGAWNKLRLCFEGFAGEFAFVPGRLIEVRVPRPGKRNILRAQISDGARTRTASVMLEPVREWKVEFILSSHEDLGYEDYINRIPAGCEILTELAMDCMDAFPDYRYFIENIDWLRGIETYGGPKVAEQLKKHIADGRMDVGFLPCGVHTHWHGAEQLARSTYAAKKYARPYGIKPETALLADVSGFSSAAVSAYAQAGVKYMINGHNRWRDTDAPYPIPPLFWWQAQNGRDRLLFWSQESYQDQHFVSGRLICPWSEPNQGYPSRNQPSPVEKLRLCADKLKNDDLTELDLSISEYLNGLSKEPWDIVPVAFYVDRQLPTLYPKAFIDLMSKKWQWPKFEMSTPTACMRRLADGFGDRIPTFTGDLSDQWGDFMTAMPEITSIKRRAQRYMPAAQTLYDLSGNPNDGRFEEAMDRMHDFDEHCWATSIKYPIEMHRFNLQYVKAQNARIVENTFERSLRQVVGKEDDTHISVLNPLPEDRRTPLMIPADVAKGRSVTGAETQQMYDGRVLTSPLSLAALSLTAFETGEAERNSRTFADLKDGQIITERYQLKYDVQSGRILAITDTKRGISLLDADSPYSLVDYLFVEADGKLSPEIQITPAENKGYRVDAGPLCVSLIRDSYEPQSRAHVQTAVTLYRDMDGIDVEIAVKDAVNALVGSHADRYKKNIFFAFPFAANEPHFYTETPLGYTDEVSGRLPLRCRDFVVAQDTVRVEAGDGSHGIMLVSDDMPVFHLGGIHYNRFSSELSGDNAHVYVYAASNRCAQLAHLSQDECRFNMRFALIPYSKEDIPSLTAISESCLLRPLAFSGNMSSPSALTLYAPPSVRLCAFKRSEDGRNWVLRVRECTGLDCDASVLLPFAPADARYSTIDEDIMEKGAEIRGRKVLFKADAHSYTTLMIAAEGDKGAPQTLQDERMVKNLFCCKAYEGGTIICWEKSSLGNGGKYVVSLKGGPVATVPNEPFLCQFTVLPMESGEGISVKYIEEA